MPLNCGIPIPTHRHIAFCSLPGCQNVLHGKQKEYCSRLHKDVMWRKAAEKGMLDLKKVDRLIQKAWEDSGNAIHPDSFFPLYYSDQHSGKETITFKGSGAKIKIRIKNGGMHTGSLDSKVYQAILARLAQGSATTWELQELTGSMATSTVISAVRKLISPKRNIVCTYVGKSESGRKVYKYELVNN